MLNFHPFYIARTLTDCVCRLLNFALSVAMAMTPIGYHVHFDLVIGCHSSNPSCNRQNMICSSLLIINDLSHEGVITCAWGTCLYVLYIVPCPQGVNHKYGVSLNFSMFCTCILLALAPATMSWAIASSLWKEGQIWSGCWLVPGDLFSTSGYGWD